MNHSINLRRALVLMLANSIVYAVDDVCTDVPNWKDSLGDGCDWYEADIEHCILYGNAFPSSGYTAGTACCFCGGGSHFDLLCDDVTIDGEPWKDSDGDGCDWYNDIHVGDDDYFYDDADTRCVYYGEEYEKDGFTALSACCVCGGGVRIEDFFFDDISAPPLEPVTDTDEPSEVPNASPILETTTDPSNIPSTTPTFVPSTTPTMTQSGTPSTTPSSTPSATPSGTPSSTPSSTPSTTPSTTPSATPSTTPSATPSTTPSATPSGTPSMTPSTSPSTMPTITYLPTRTPSSIPSAERSSVNDVIAAAVRPHQYTELCESSVTIENNDSDGFMQREDIIVSFVNCNAGKYDWIAMYTLDAMQNGTVPAGAVTWLKACGTRTCREAVSAGQIVFENINILPGNYQMHLLKSFEPPYHVAAYSPPILITNGTIESMSPTSSPTTQASAYPTIEFSVSPTGEISTKPTTIPSISLSMGPTEVLSTFPTFVPTPIPSSVPTATPSSTPSTSLTSTPSLLPTLDPTTTPSITPSSNPSITASLLPTSEPSTTPSITPSSEPTTAPSMLPTSEPSTTPSITPSSKPTTAPSLLSTSEPSMTSSITSSPKPTTAPSLLSTSEPSTTPSKTMSSKPTTDPSLLSTSEPSTVSKVCQDIPGWSDTENAGCSWYEEPVLEIDFYEDGDTRCDLWGSDVEFASDGYIANLACCACGGGIVDGVIPFMITELPSTYPTAAPSTSFPSNSPSTSPPSKGPSLDPTPATSNIPTMVISQMPTQYPSVSPTWGVVIMTEETTIRFEGIETFMDDTNKAIFEAITAAFVMEYIPTSTRPGLADYFVSNLTTPVTFQRVSLSDQNYSLDISFNITSTVEVQNQDIDFDYKDVVFAGFYEDFDEYLRRLNTSSSFFPIYGGLAGSNSAVSANKGDEENTSSDDTFFSDIPIAEIFLVCGILVCVAVLFTLVWRRKNRDTLDESNDISVPVDMPVTPMKTDKSSDCQNIAGLEKTGDELVELPLGCSPFQSAQVVNKEYISQQYGICGDRFCTSLDDVMHDNIFADNNKGTEERVQEVLDEQTITKSIATPLLEKSNEMEQHENENVSSHEVVSATQ